MISEPLKSGLNVTRCGGPLFVATGIERSVKGKAAWPFSTLQLLTASDRARGDDVRKFPLSIRAEGLLTGEVPIVATMG